MLSEPRERLVTHEPLRMRPRDPEEKIARARVSEHRHRAEGDVGFIGDAAPRERHAIRQRAPRLARRLEGDASNVRRGVLHQGAEDRSRRVDPQRTLRDRQPQRGHDPVDRPHGPRRLEDARQVVAVTERQPVEGVREARRLPRRRLRRRAREDHAIPREPRRAAEHVEILRQVTAAEGERRFTEHPTDVLVERREPPREGQGLPERAHLLDPRERVPRRERLQSGHRRHGRTVTTLRRRAIAGQTRPRRAHSVPPWVPS